MKHYPTPAWCTHALLDQHPPLIYDMTVIHEPCAGEGAICSVLKERFPHAFLNATEIDRGHRATLIGICHCVATCDWLKNETKIDGSDAIITNPPYRPDDIMIRIVERAVTSDANYVAMLLPLRFFGSKQRLPFLLKRPPTHLYPLSPRPKFTGAGGYEEVAWFVWDYGRTHLQRIKVLTHGEI